MSAGRAFLPSDLWALRRALSLSAHKYTMTPARNQSWTGRCSQAAWSTNPNLACRYTPRNGSTDIQLA